MQGHSGNIVEIEQDLPEEPNSERHEIYDKVIHISGEGDNWQAWLNTDHADFDGLCIAFGKSRDECFEQMVQLFEGVLSKLIVVRGNAS